MSGYNFTIVKLRHPVASIHHIAPTMLTSVGTVEAIKHAISESFLGTTWTETPGGATGRWWYPGQQTWIDFNVYQHGHHFVIDSAFGEADYPLVSAFCERGGWTACDSQLMRILGANISAGEHQ